MLGREADQFAHIAHPHLLHHAGTVFFDRLRAEHQLLCNLGIGMPFDDELQHLSFASGETVQRASTPRLKSTYD